MEEKKLIIPQDIYNRIESDAQAWSENQYGHDDINKDYLEGALHEAMIAQAEYVRLSQTAAVWVKASAFKTHKPVYRPYRKPAMEDEGEYDYGEIYVTEDDGRIYLDVDNECNYEHQSDERWKDYDILDESGTTANVLPTFWDVAKAFKWAAEHKTEKGESLMLADGWCLIHEGGVTEELTPGNVAELYCLQNGFTKEKEGSPAAAREEPVSKEVIDFIRDIAKNWGCDEDGHKYNTGCRKCSASELLYDLTKQQKEK